MNRGIFDEECIICKKTLDAEKCANDENSEHQGVCNECAKETCNNCPALLESYFWTHNTMLPHFVCTVTEEPLNYMKTNGKWIALKPAEERIG